MLAIKNLFRKFFRTVPVAAALLVLGGCTPPGPKALLEGDRLLDGKKYSEALEKLKTATELMPENPRAWNHLGLAYHATGQPQPAIVAYKQALALNRSNVINVAHFNLGCVLLEQNNLPAAIDELKSFTMLTNSAPALNKLGTAQLRARQPDAEKSFTAALKLRPRDPEALNGLGLVQVQRGHPREAAQFFNAALLTSPQYGPALHNYAVLAQQQPATRPAALQKFRDYLALQPRAPNWETVNAAARQLELELAPAARTAVTNVVAGLAPLKTNPVVVAVHPLPPVVSNAVPRVNVVTQQVAVVRPPVTPVTTVALTNQPIAPPPTNERVVVRPPIPPRTNLVVAANSAEVKTNRPGFFTRLNPFRAKSKPETNEPSTVVRVAAVTTTNAAVAPRVVAVPAYVYLSPARPAAGNRAEADRAYQRGLLAQQAGRTLDAMVAFRAATQADPSWFEAHSGLGLAAFQTGDWKQALAEGEMALALNADSKDARYNFALALKQAGYPRDAAVELEKILQASPDEVRAHLTLGNLYSQPLAQPKMARAHYLQVLELDPRNAQAGLIRSWLATNP